MVDEREREIEIGTCALCDINLEASAAELYPQGKVPPGELVDPVEHRVAAGVEAAALTGRVELASGRERREELVSVRVQALSVLISLRGPRAFALRDPADRSGYATGDRSATGVLEDRGQPQDFACAHRRLRVVGSQVAVLCDRNRRKGRRVLCENARIAKSVLFVKDVDRREVARS